MGGRRMRWSLELNKIGDRDRLEERMLKYISEDDLIRSVPSNELNTDIKSASGARWLLNNVPISVGYFLNRKQAEGIATILEEVEGTEARVRRVAIG